jgi:hypothetical protein
MNMHLPGAVARSLLRRLRGGLVVCAAVALAACGGDNDCSGDPPFEGSGNVGSCSDDDDGGSATPTAADLSLALSAKTLPNDGTSTITATVTAVDANRNALGEIPVTVSVNADAVATVSGTATDSKGVVTAAIGAGADRANRMVTVTARSGNLERTATFQVVGAGLSGTPLPAVIEPGAAGQVVFQLVDISGSGPAMGGQTIVVNGVDGVEVSGTTDDNGKYTYDYTAPTATGSVSIKATAGGVSNTQTVLVQASGSSTIPPATIAVQSASLAGSPSVVSANTDNTTNQSELRALFLGAGNTPVKNVRVRFDLAGDANNVGGTITSGSNLVYSDANGVATTSYVPGSRFSPTDGLTVRACWSEKDFAAGTCPNATTTTLTVISQPLSVSIGTDALIEVEGQTYVKRYTVQVVDSSGLAKGGVLISPSIDLLQYFKGQWVVSIDKWVKVQRASCDNEDLNRNGVLQTYSNGVNEDANGTGFIEPRKADVAISFVGSNTTDSNGQVELKITYPQNVGSWLKFNIQVAAGGVAGTEGRTNYTGVLPVLADAVADPSKEPPFVVSPYGTSVGDNTSVEYPVGSGQFVSLCTNPN